MAKTTDLPFDGGAIVAPGGETTSAQVHNVFLREITVTDLGRESIIYALFDMDKPTTTAPYFEPVSAFNLAEWCINGDVVQVDLAEVMAQDTDRYSGVLQDIVLSNDAQSGLYVSACKLRTMVKRDSTTVRFSWFSLRLIMDQDTGISYLATPEYGSPTIMDIPDHKVKIGGVYSQESPNYLEYKIMGDGSTVNVQVIDEDILGNPIDPYLRISAIEGSGDGKVLVDYLDDSRDYLANKVSGTGSIISQVNILDGFRYLEMDLKISDGSFLDVLPEDSSWVEQIGDKSYRVGVMPDGKIWMCQNLDYKFEYNGSTLPIGSSGTPNMPAAWYYDNDEANYGIGGTYKCGLLYNGHAVKYLEDNRATLIPGWHVASAAEWDALATAVGGASNAGTRLKAKNNTITSNWPSGWTGTDDYGFSVLPAGCLNAGSFTNINRYSFFWTGTEYSSNEFDIRIFSTNTPMESNRRNRTYYAYNIRLVKNNT